MLIQLQTQFAPSGESAADEPVGMIAAAANGDIAAFEGLYRRFSPRVYGLCLRLTGQREAAEDCTQESFVCAWRGLARFGGRSRFSTWLQQIAIRTVLARRRGLRARHEVEAPPGGLPEVAAPGETGATDDLERAIAKLPEGARDVLVLVAIYGYSHAEAAQALGVAEGTSKAQLHRARTLLAAALGVEPT
jgi:RNA polymerase sigma-70 factor (ECF subfamily)